MALSKAFGHVGRMFGHRGAVVGLLLALAALVAMPMLGMAHQVGDSDHDPDCAYDFCHSPEFMPPAPTFQISDNIGESQDIGVLPTATDADHSDPNQDYTMVYTLRDGDAPVADDDEDKPEYVDGDAAAFYIYNDGGQRKLRTAIDHYETRVYRLKLVACDGNFRRGYIDVTITVNDAPGEPPLAPDRPHVEGASTSSLVVRWTAPDNTGRAPITSYDLQYWESGTQNWRNGPQNRTDTYAVISGLTENTQYEVQVRATNEDGDGPWSLPGTGRTKTAGNNPPVFLEGTSATRSFAENTLPSRDVGESVTATGESTLAYSLEGTDAAAFDIVATSGQIRTIDVTYDYEDAISNTYNVMVKATDQNANSATITVNISLTDVDEPPERPAAPVVSTASDTSLSVSWTKQDYTDRPPITSFDLQYRRGTSGSWTDGPQDVPGTTLDRTITDLEMNAQYQVQVRATNDEGDSLWSPPGSGRTNVTGNDPPVFPGTSTTRSFDENTAAGQPVGAPVTADDDDTLAYSLEGPDASSFTIVRASGQIRTRSGVTYDFETRDTYTVTVKATDPHQISDTITVTIRLDDVWEPPDAPAAPRVASESISSVSVTWNPPSNNRGRPPIIDYALQYRPCPDGQCPSDPEEAWEDGPQNVADTTDIIMGLHDGTRYQVRVRARNDESRPTDENWSPPGSGRTFAVPKFEDGPAMRDLAENTPGGRNVDAAVSATDADGDRLTYSLAGTDALSFDIVTSSGQIRTIDVTYDHEARSSYEVTVKASDPSGNSATIEVAITITDVDEPPLRPAAPAVSTASDTSLSVSWTAPDNAGRPPITSYDLQYRRGTSGSWSGGPQDVSGTSSTIPSLNGGTSYQVQVRATNDEGDSPWSQPGSARTNVAGNNLPEFGSDSTTRSFDENTAAGEPVGAPVTADDDDTLAYTLEGVDVSSFTIGRDSGQIMTRRGVTYDFETKDTYTVAVKATDPHQVSDTITVTIRLNDVPEPPDAPAAPRVSSESISSVSVSWNPPSNNRGRPPITGYDLQYRPCPDGRCPSDPEEDWRDGPQGVTETNAIIMRLSDGTRYQVRLRAENHEMEGPWSRPGSGRTLAVPKFEDGTAMRSLAENTPGVREVGAAVRATDADNDRLTYSLEEGVDAASFDIVTTSGQIRTRAGEIYDHEAKSSYRVTVRASDPSMNSATIAVDIEITDVLEPPLRPAAPVVSTDPDSSMSLLVSWTAPDNLGRPPITSYDLQYRRGTSGSWTEGPQDLAATSRSATIPGLNENTPYQVQVRATNDEGDGPWSLSGSGRTLDANNAAPTFVPNTQDTLSFPENTLPGHNVGTFAATDVDNDLLTYALGGQDAASFDFVIVGTSRQITTKSGVTYDHEAKPTYFVTVKVSDPGGASTAIIVTINVTDVNEPPDAPAAPSVSSASTTSLSVIWSPPADNRGRPPITGYRLQYREVGSPSWTGPRNQSGTSTTITSLNAGTQYEVQVMARNHEGDSDWSASGFGRTNVAGNSPPDFGIDMTTRSFRENTPPNRNVGAPVTATDDDGGTLTYTLEGRDKDSFTIVETSGQIRTKSGVTYDYETKRTYFVTVKADDEMGGTDIIAVTINLIDVVSEGGGGGGGGNGGGGGDGDGGVGSTSNTAPGFGDSADTGSFPENTPPGQDIGAPVTATDPDGDPLVYTLEGLDAALFDIDPETGQIKTKSGVTYDYETKPSYSVIVKVEDDEGASGTIAVTLVVTDVDEQPATPAAPTVRAPEGSSTSLLVSWKAPDRNGGPPLTGYGVEYRQGTVGDWKAWQHDGTATSTTITELRAHTDYQVRVRALNDETASDWSPPGSGQTNNTAPVFANADAIRSFPENTPPGENIGTPVAAVDPDGDPLTYALEGADTASFDIEPGTGQIKTKTGVTYDHETKASYSVTVRATDPLDASDTVTVTINVTDVAEKPSYASSTATRSVVENTPAGQNIGTPISATDPDGDSLTYTLEGLAAVSFAIESSTGQLKTQSGVSYDYETKSSYSVTVRATDPLDASDTVAVTINVTDVAEKPATPGVPTVRAPEGSSTSLLVTWTAPDTNGGPPLTDYDVQYRQGASGDWNDWQHDGIATTTTIMSLEPHADYQVRVRALNDEAASDWSPPGNGQTNNTAPAFASAADTRRFPENTPPGQDIGAPITATDPDGDPLTYTLAGPDAASFDIEAESGQLKTKAGVTYDHEVKASYAVTVRATDPLDAGAIIAVTVLIMDVDEKPATPDAPTVRAIDGSGIDLLATWIAPDTNGGPPLIGYDVQYRQGSTGDWNDWENDGTGTTATIAGLSTSTDYQVRVRALNGEAPSDWSPPGSGRTNATMDGWLARFGRTVAQQVVEGVEDRLRSPCREGLQGAIAGHGFGGAARSDLGMLSRWADDDMEAERLFDVRLLAERDPLTGSRFELSGETAGGGVACVWGRGVRSGFDGREGTFSLDGEVTTGTLGADYGKGPWTVGLALSHSRGEGSYGRGYGKDDVEASLTGFYPYAGYKFTERFSVWGLGGLGRGALRLTPQGGFSIETDMGLTMAAVGVRSALLTAARGLNVALQTDGFWARTVSDAAAGLLAAKADATRLRLGLESSYTVVLKTGGTLTPRFEVAWRYDGGGAEAGPGLDVGVGLVWLAPARGISVEIETRRVLMHEATRFRDWSVSGLVRYDPSPSSDRGLSASIRSSTGAAGLDGVDALLARDTLSGLSPYDGSLTAEAAYGFPILGGRFTGAPWAGAGMLGSGRDYRVGYRVSTAWQSGSAMQLGIEGVRRENNVRDAETEHAIGLRLTLGW